MTKSRRLYGLVLGFGLLSAAVPARADPVQGWGPFTLRPGDVLRATFDLRALPPDPDFSTYDVLIFMPGVSVVEPVGSYTTRLSDRGQLLGTYRGSGANASQMGFGSWFIAPGSPYTRGDPTVVDFSTLRDRSFDGAVEFQIDDGLAHIYRASDELDFDRTLTPDIASGYGFSPRTFEIVTPDPVPEPASLLLVGSGVAGLLCRRRRWRRLTPRVGAAALGAIGLCVSASTAAAEPVTFRFDVRIDYRCTVDACDAFTASFPMTMTVDALVSRTDTPWNHERWYGVPSFSAVPLDRPAVHPDAAPMYTPAFDGTFVYDGAWRRVAHAYSGSEWTTAAGTFNWNTSVYRVEDNVWPLPSLTRETMAEFLGSGRGSGFFGYNYSGQLPGGGLSPDSLAYIGTATLAETAAPVPEPASLLLLGTGLGWLGIRRRRDAAVQS